MNPLIAIGLKGNFMDTLLEIGKQVPTLTVLVLLVIFFLRSWADDRKSAAAALAEMVVANSETVKQMQSSFLSGLRDVQAENTQARIESREALKDNTVAMREMAKITTELVVLVKTKT